MKKMVKRVAASLLAVLAGCSMFLCAACEFDTSSNGDKTTLENSSGNQTDVNVEQGAGNGNSGNVQKPAVQKPKPAYEGTIVSAGGEYAFTSKIAFLSEDLEQTEGEGEESTYEPVSVTLKATVLPADANQGVTWTAEFVNPESEWASGKSVNDYMSVVSQDVSSIVDVTCKAPFGEQIKIICTSVENEEASASCTVDFMQTMENVTLQFGEDLPINLGGTTDVAWEINPNGVGVGGMANVNIQTNDVYTIAETYTWKISLGCPKSGLCTDCQRLTTSGNTTGYDNLFNLTYMGSKFDWATNTPTETEIMVQVLYNAWYAGGTLLGGDAFITNSNYNARGFDLVFDYTLFNEMNVYVSEGPGTAFSSGFYVYDILTTGGAGAFMGAYTLQEGTFAKLKMQITAEQVGTTETFESLINITEFTNVAKVQSVVLDNSNLSY